MAIQFKCDACGNVIQVADEHAGLDVKCPGCGAIVAAPPTPPRMTPPTQGMPIVLPPDDTRKGLAIAAMIFGILGLCLFPLALIAVVLGIIAVVKASNRPTEYGGKGPAVVGICTGGIGLLLVPVVALLISILLPSLARSRELARRTVCGANLLSMGTGFSTYGSESSWPAPPHWSDSDRDRPVTYVGAIGDQGGISTTAWIWNLVVQDIISPRAIVCPSSQDAPWVVPDPENYKDVAAYRHCSYGIQVPFGKYGAPHSDRHQQMGLAADKGPFGAVADGPYTASPNRPALSTLGRGAGRNDWRWYNSPNHGGFEDGEGQNVLYPDGHVEWHSKPLAGVKDDNIYTAWPSPDADDAGRMRGIAPDTGAHSALVPAGNTDSLIYP